jgi:hypothetical protein
MRATQHAEDTTGDSALKWDVFVTPGIPTVSNVDLPPGQRKAYVVPHLVNAHPRLGQTSRLEQIIVILYEPLVT